MLNLRSATNVIHRSPDKGDIIHESPNSAQLERFVYKILVIIVTLWIGNGAVLKSSSQ